MKRPQGRAALAVCTSVALAAFAAGTAKAAQSDIVITEQDNGKDVTLHDGQRLIIKLPRSGGTPYSWSALMEPDSILAFTTAPEEKPRDKPANALPMVGGPGQEIFAFKAAHFTESSSQWFRLIFCGVQCDLKDSNAKMFKIGVTTMKK
jgi:predicted secreted protein